MINIVRESNISTSRIIEEFVSHDVIDLSSKRQLMIESLVLNSSSRRQTYKIMNPDFSVSPIYSKKHSIDERYRISFTCFRLSSHNLACEMGRWNKRGRGRLQPNQRVCNCGLVQSEKHVIEECTLTSHLRQSYGYTLISDVFSHHFTGELMCKVIHEILSVYD